MKKPASRTRSRDERKEAAKKLAEERAGRTDQQQLSKLDREGHTAKKERARLKARIKEAQQKKKKFA